MHLIRQALKWLIGSGYLRAANELNRLSGCHSNSDLSAQLRQAALNLRKEAKQG